MAVQKFKKSKAKTRQRRSINSKVAFPNLIECPNCGTKIIRHRVCNQCGFYKNKIVVEKE